LCPEKCFNRKFKTNLAHPNLKTWLRACRQAKSGDELANNTFSLILMQSNGFKNIND